MTDNTVSVSKSFRLVGIKIRFFTCLPQASPLDQRLYRQVGIFDPRLPAAGRFYSSIYSDLIMRHYIFPAT
jgi:hypothetical protein